MKQLAHIRQSMINKTLFILFLSFLSCCDSKNSELDLNNTNWAYIPESFKDEYPYNRTSYFELSFSDDSVAYFPNNEIGFYSEADSIINFDISGTYKIIYRDNAKLELLRGDTLSLKNLALYRNKSIEFESVQLSIGESIWGFKEYDIIIHDNGDLYYRDREQKRLYHSVVEDSLMKKIQYSVQIALLDNSVHVGEIDGQSCYLNIVFKNREHFLTRGTIGEMHGLHILIGELRNLIDKVNLTEMPDTIRFKTYKDLRASE